MKLHRLEDLHVRQLEHLFSPPGLPLVAKAGPKSTPTTTVLVRGEAGAGKTTLALAVAHSIARDRKGVLLVLNTETAPVEVDAKAAFLHLPRKTVLSWAARARARRGTILVQHIALTPPPEAIDPPEAEPARLEMLDVLWEMLRAYQAEDPERTPIVAVLIDGLLLSERDEGPTRGDTAAFLQALETRGISTVLVEESTPAANSWLPFVVDLVFELRFNISPDTEKFTRQLVCRKSRYAPALAGPHEYDRDEESILSVWPDPLDLSAATLRAIRGASPPEPTLFWTPNMDHKFWVRRGGGLVCANMSREWDIILAMDSPLSPLKSLAIDFDAHLSSPEHPAPLTVALHGRGGAYGIAWQILRASKTREKNAFIIHEFNRLESIAGSPRALERTLLALVRSGLFIGVRGRDEEIAKLIHIASFSPSQYKLDGIRDAPKRQTIAVERWLAPATACSGLKPGDFASFREFVPIWQQLQALAGYDWQSATPDLAALEAVHRRLHALSQSVYTSPVPVLVLLDALRVVDRIYGTIIEHLGVLARAATNDARVASHFALAWHLEGDDWNAARLFTQTDGARSPVDMVLWNSFCLRHADDEGASLVLGLHVLLRGDFARLAAANLARAHAHHGRHAEARACIETASADLSPWLRRRWLAEVAADAGDDAVLEAAEQTLRELAGDPAGPLLQRAEVCLNLGLLAERRGDTASANSARAQALALNPRLQGVADRLLPRPGQAQTPPDDCEQR